LVLLNFVVVLILLNFVGVSDTTISFLYGAPTSLMNPFLLRRTWWKRFTKREIICLGMSFLPVILVVPVPAKLASEATDSGMLEAIDTEN
jgi:hypothetical protein